MKKCSNVRVYFFFQAEDGIRDFEKPVSERSVPKYGGIFLCPPTRGPASATSKRKSRWNWEYIGRRRRISVGPWKLPGYPRIGLLDFSGYRRRSSGDYSQVVRCFEATRPFSA